ncbi:anaerobic ribonucleoside-triphosphate reductase activating protein [Odoribacter lunatus]|uniref:anaerobic ribonucleoside-triphosphate reductase activating protein n=1 Tax=Odoribacter lunatus TaxID=2941335 RepID=UPI00203DB4BB|nr:anaerobic ribonucleoside-triphosphate reductase activating protein [Odoribacter lunatus]
MKENTILLMDVLEDTVVDGPGFRTVIYAAGCRHACPGCHNPQSWNMGNGHPVEVDTLVRQVLDDPFADVTFSGGDPLLQVEAFTALARQIKKQSRKTIWCYTGYRYETVVQSPRLFMLLPHIDVLVDGRFEQKLHDDKLLFRGSSNQRIIDVKASLAAKTVVGYRMKE